MVLESSVERRFQRYCKKQGYKAFKIINQSANGFPDRTVLMPGGRVAFIELKKDDGDVSPLQQHWIDVLRKLGFSAGVAFSFEQAVELLK